MHGFATRANCSDARVPIIWQPEFNRCATVFTEFKRAWGSAHGLNFKDLEKVFILLLELSLVSHLLSLSLHCLSELQKHPQGFQSKLSPLAVVPKRLINVR